ncbi:MAG: polysaccharide deacetylase family protein [Oscillospiraceae bacterium]|nr:polysaccharide deacetylase family protein [Oscillospiraceae bacterium]
MLKKIFTAFLAATILTLSVNAESTGQQSNQTQPNAQSDELSVKLPIIMYHFLTENKGEHHISTDEFERDLFFLKQNGYNTIGISDLIAFVNEARPLPPNPIMLTFDDGYYNNYVNGFPLLQKYNAKAVISVIGDHTDIWSANFYEDIQAGHITWGMIREMRDSGLVEFGNHTYSMHFIKNGRKGSKRKPDEELFDYQRLFGRDVNRLQARFIEETGVAPDLFAFPYHAFCDEAIQVLQILGIRAAFTGSGKYNTIKTGDADCLYRLCRTNRSRLRPIENILT